MNEEQLIALMAAILHSGSRVYEESAYDAVEDSLIILDATRHERRARAERRTHIQRSTR